MDKGLALLGFMLSALIILLFFGTLIQFNVSYEEIEVVYIDEEIIVFIDNEDLYWYSDIKPEYVMLEVGNHISIKRYFTILPFPSSYKFNGLEETNFYKGD